MTGPRPEHVCARLPLVLLCGIVACGPGVSRDRPSPAPPPSQRASTPEQRNPATQQRQTGPLPQLRSFERDMVRAINEIRKDAGPRALAVTADLVAVARAHSEDQARTGKSRHEGSDGRGPVQRVRERSIGYRALAENVAMNRGYDDPVRAAVDAWMSSSGHRKNILDPRFTETGVGVATASDDALYFTQLFLLPPDGAQ